MGVHELQPAVVPGSTVVGAPLIHLEDVARRYRIGEREVVALADVSFDVYAEEFVVVLGPSGSGKTTLLNMIGALDSPTEGRVVVAGRDITRAAVSCRVAQVHDERVEVVGEAFGGGGVAGAVELVDERSEALLAVALVGGVVERLPVGGADAFAFALG